MSGSGSPCIGVCALDDACGVCIGCLRTVDEIAAWPTLSSAERGRILAELPGRAERRGDD